jgi:hypothetical protein
MTKKNVLLFLFVFSNYYNPFSVFLTIIINLFLLISFSKGRNVRIDNKILIFSLLILIWAIIIMVVRTNVNTYILGKYLRSTASTFLIMVICSQMRISIKEIINTLAAVFFLHILMVGLQCLFPQLDIPVADFFGFDREATVISQMSIRKMGLSSSYDTASLISVSSMVFFFLLYVEKKKNIYLFISFLSLISTIRISRTGMVIGIILFVVLIIKLYFNSKGRKRLTPILFLLVGLFVFFTVILPIIAASTDSFLSNTKYNDIDISNKDYTPGTVTGLTTGSHLNALKEPVFDLIFGFGIDPNRIYGMATDIGYIKLIYHIGLIGLFLIIFLYLYIFRKTLKMKKMYYSVTDEFMLSSFLIWYILLIIVINYKSLEMYSRGSHDLLLIIFFVLVNNHFRLQALSKRLISNNHKNALLHGNTN